MDNLVVTNQSLITWAIMIVIALGLDLGAYIFLRLDWKKNGITIIDKFWNQLFDKIDQNTKNIQNNIAIAVVKYHQASVTSDAKPAPVVVTESMPETTPAERIPVSVKNLGPTRRIQFSVEMPWDTQIEVRIGATREAGVTVEKREL